MFASKYICLIKLCISLHLFFLNCLTILFGSKSTWTVLMAKPTSFITILLRVQRLWKIFTFLKFIESNQIVVLYEGPLAKTHNKLANLYSKHNSTKQSHWFSFGSIEKNSLTSQNRCWLPKQARKCIDFIARITRGHYNFVLVSHTYSRLRYYATYSSIR